MTPYKVYTSKNLIVLKISPLQKYPIHIRERTEPRESKPHYKGQDNSYTEISHGEKNNEVYKDMGESSNREKEYTEDSEKIRTLIKTLMRLNFQKNFIRFTLTNILSFDKK